MSAELYCRILGCGISTRLNQFIEAYRSLTKLDFKFLDFRRITLSLQCDLSITLFRIESIAVHFQLKRKVGLEQSLKFCISRFQSIGLLLIISLQPSDINRLKQSLTCWIPIAQTNASNAEVTASHVQPV